VENPGKLIGNIPAAGDHDTLWQPVEVKHFVRADCMLDSVELGHLRTGAGGDEYLVGGDLASARQPQRIGAGEYRPLMENLDVMARQRLGVGALEPRYFRKHVVAQRRPVEALLRYVPAEHCGVLDILGD